MGNTCSSCCANQLPVDAVRAATSASVCTTEAATGAHYFVLTNYSLLSGMGVGKYVTSSTFSVGGYYWCIAFYPDGILQEHDSDGYAGAVLCLLSGVAETGVRAKFTLSLHEEDGKVHGSSSVLTTTQTFKSPGNSFGNSRVVHKSKLLGGDGYFTIRYDLTVVQNTPS